MQEKFAFKKTLTRGAAVLTSAAMLGMTLTGALAADLSEYPSPFTGADTVIVFGAAAGGADNAAAADIALGLPSTASAVSVGQTGRAGTTAYVPTQGPQSDYEKWEDIPIGVQFNTTTDGFGDTVDADDIEGFQDTTIDIDIDEVDDDYDVRDEIRFGGTFITPTNVLQPETGLNFDGDEDWKDRVFVPMRQSSWGYFYIFEDNLRAGNFINTSDTDDEIEIEFLGKRFEIEGTSGGTIANNLVINVGQRFYMEAGDTVVVDGKELTLVQTAAAAATVSVDGAREVISNNDEEIVNGLEIRIEDVSSDEGIEYDSATVFAGEDARETYASGEEFIGEDEDDPAWVWQLANLTGNQPVIGILWHLDLDSPDEDDNPLYEHPMYEGESVCLPFDYACIIFDSLEIDDYQDYEIETNEVTDLYLSVANSTNNNKDVTGERVLEITAKGSSDDGFLTCSAFFNDNGGNNTCAVGGMTTETDRVSMAVYSNYSMTGLRALSEMGAIPSTEGTAAAETGNFNTGALLLFREEQDGSDEILFNVIANGTIVQQAFRIEYRDTVLDVGIDATNAASGCAVATEPYNALGRGGHGNWSMFITPNTRGRNITVYFETDEDITDCSNAGHNDLAYIGHADSDTTTARDFIYGDYRTGNDGLGTVDSIDISGKEEDLRTANGMIILDPESHQSSDDFEFRVPSDIDDFKANIVIRTSGAAGASGALYDVATPGSTVGGPAQMSDAEVGDVSAYNALVVGGPAVNSVAADLLGLPFPSYGAASGLSPGEAKLTLVQNGAKYALLAYGYEAQDTRRAGVVLKNHEDFALAGDALTVRGSSLEVAGITVE